MKLFNRLFRNGKFSTQWANFAIIPIFKKGDSENPSNYIGIAIIGLLSKLYISTITKRLTLYTEAYSTLSKSQAGFRAGYRTTDNAFILYSLVSKYIRVKSKPLYVCFVDFQKAFDSVNRRLLYNVLHKNGVKGNLLKSIQSIYSNVKSCVKTANCGTASFACLAGLRQGCNLSPFQEHGIRGIQLFPDILELFMLLFVDDSVCIVDTIAGLQRQLNVLQEF